MTKRMLIDSTHAEETRVVVLDGNRLEDYDVETSTKQQLKGNIYLAKVVRVEPSLQAAFVEYGGGRHGFLAFGEIHPDYYQIPVADRQRLMEMQETEAREEEEAEDRAAAREGRGSDRSPAAADALTQAAYATQADPEEAVDPLPRPAQVAQAASVTQDILVAPEEAEAMFPPETPGGDGADMAPEAAGSDAATTPATAMPATGGTEASLSEANQPGAPDDGLGHEGGIEGAPDADAPASQPDPVDSPPSEPDAGPAPHEAVPSDSEPPETVLLDSGVPALDSPGAYPNGHGAASLDALDPLPAEGPGDAGPADLDALPASPADLNALPASPADLDALPASLDDADTGYAGPAEPPPEPAGGADGDDQREQRATPRFLRNYKIQEVIRRRQILLVQVVKEERGTKGAALTTYISLAGRFSVLMPNSPRGGGISRKITSAADRRRLKEITAELDLPRGMGLIVRTAGAQRPKAEILRDCEYLLDQWDQIRELTMKSMAPALIYEEASLIKRAIRDVYSRDVDDILVDGEQGWRAARDFMRMLMPTHAKKVQLWKDPQPLFAKAQVEQQLDAMMLPTVQLRSGGYLVINQTEALVAIDVNSGRSTRERGIEETALRTNLEAAEEAARQLRLRDLAGLIVIDFIDMESRRNNAAVEKKLKDALRNDRARIQLGSISHFGLLEMSRQRLRPSLAETSFITCPHCAGTGTVRSTESAALHVLRGVEEEGGKRRAAEIVVHVAGSIALYILNNKRVRLAEIEQRHGMKVAFAADESLLPPEVRIDRVRAAAASDLPVPVQQLAPPEPFEDPDEEPVAAADVAADDPDDLDAEEGDAEAAPRPGESAEEREQRGKRRRRRRRGGRRDEAVAGEEDAPLPVAAAEAPHDDAGLAAGDAAAGTAPPEAGGEPVAAAGAADAAPGEPATEDADRAKRRGRRGGRRRRRDGTEGAAEDGQDEALAAPAPVHATPAYSAPAYSPPAYSGPTPADPFGGVAAFDIFDAIEQAEQQRALAAFAPPSPAAAAAAQPQAALAPATDDAAEARLAGVTPVIDEMLLAEPVIMLPEMVSVEDPGPAQAAPAATEEPAPEPAAPELAVPELAAPEVVSPAALASESAAAEAPAPVVTETPASEPAAVASLAAASNGPAMPEPAMPEPAMPEPAMPEQAAPGPAMPDLAPAIVPVLVGEAEPADKKRGWWRR